MPRPYNTDTETAEALGAIESLTKGFGAASGEDALALGRAVYRSTLGGHEHLVLRGMRQAAAEMGHARIVHVLNLAIEAEERSRR